MYISNFFPNTYIAMFCQFIRRWTWTNDTTVEVGWTSDTIWFWRDIKFSSSFLYKVFSFHFKPRCITLSLLIIGRPIRAFHMFDDPVHFNTSTRLYLFSIFCLNSHIKNIGFVSISIFVAFKFAYVISLIDSFIMLPRILRCLL